MQQIAKSCCLIGTKPLYQHYVWTGLYTVLKFHGKKLLKIKFIFRNCFWMIVYVSVTGAEIDLNQLRNNNYRHISFAYWKN